MSPTSYEYRHLRVEQEGRVVWVTLDNPPINLITKGLYIELLKLSKALEADTSVTVVVFKSANPDFFLAHFDVTAILEFPTEGDAARSDEPNPFHVMCNRFQSMDKVTIAQIEGRAGGGGSELAASMDMRFGVLGKTVINQMEVPLGILPGGSGTQRLPRLVGRGRALEIILGADDLDAETAERWGYLNRALDADTIGPFVDNLARRIAGFPPEAVRLAKAAIGNAERPLDDGLREESFLFEQLLRTADAPEAMRRFLNGGGQTRPGELRIGALNTEF